MKHGGAEVQIEQSRRSHLSLAFASETVCQPRFDTESRPPHASGRMWSAMCPGHPPTWPVARSKRRITASLRCSRPPNTTRRASGADPGDQGLLIGHARARSQPSINRLQLSANCLASWLIASITALEHDGGLQTQIGRANLKLSALLVIVGRDCHQSCGSGVGLVNRRRLPSPPPSRLAAHRRTPY